MDNMVEVRVYKAPLNKVIRYLITEIYNNDCPKWITIDYYKSKDTRIRQIECSNGKKKVYKLKNSTVDKQVLPLENLENELSEISKVIKKEYLFTIKLDNFTGIVERVYVNNTSFMSIEFEIDKKHLARLKDLIKNELHGYVTTSSLYDYITNREPGIQE